MFKLVYVLISNGTDIYYSQMYVSILSARFYMKDVEIELLVDGGTYHSLRKSRPEIFSLVSVIKIDVDDSYSSKQKSRFLKTTMRKYVTGDFLFIDCDTIICDDFSDYYNDASLALVLDAHVPLHDFYGYESLAILNKNIGFDISVYKNYYNSGVIWCRDLPETHNFFSLWHKIWKEHLTDNLCLDQPALNYVNTLLQPLIKELNGEWNCQVSSKPSGLPYLSNAHIIHYFNFNTVSYKLSNKEYVLNLKKDDLDAIIRNPRKLFVNSSIIAYSSNEHKLMSTKLFGYILMIYTKYPNAFSLIEYIIGAIHKIKRLLLNR